MRIIFVNRFFWPDHSATSQLLSDLASDVAVRGHQVQVLTSRQRIDDPRAALAARETFAGVDVRRLWTFTFGRDFLVGRALDYASFYVSATWQLWRICQPGDVVVAQTDPPLISVFAAWVARRRGAHLVNWLHDVFPEIAQNLGVRGLGGRLARWLQRLRNWSLDRARANVALGEKMAGYLRKQDLAPERIRIIHNWADGEAIRPVAADSNRLRDEWSLAGRFVVGYSGNMGRAHNLDVLLDAASLVRNSRICFLFIGGGQQQPLLAREVGRRNLPNVYFKPYQPRAALGESLSLADVQIVSLREELEGLMVPSKFYAAAAAGRPVIFIGAPDGEVATLVHRHRCGQAVSSGDAGILGSCIESLAADPSRCAALGQNARDAFECYFSKDRSLAAWHELLESMAPQVAGDGTRSLEARSWTVT